VARRAADIGGGAAQARAGAADRRNVSGRPRPTELWYALAAIVVVTVLYVLAYQQADAFPAASGLVGHGIGIAGFVLMLMTATLYSLRKLRTDARWGSTAGWLRFHMVTGLVGPYMVLLHTTMRFQGLAGLAMLLTVVVVVSGLIGRYLYTLVPRVVDEDGAAGGGGGGGPPAPPPPRPHDCHGATQHGLPSAGGPAAATVPLAFSTLASDRRAYPSHRLPTVWRVLTCTEVL